MPNNTCRIDGCEKRPTGHHTKCSMHNSRAARARLKQDGPKKLCGLPECDRPHSMHGYCEMHARRAKKYGDPRHEWDATAPRVEGTTYRLAHERLKAARGRAPEHQCVDCGARAQDWSYIGGAPDEQADDKGRPFSADFDFYAPRCRNCHRAFDWVAKNPTCQAGHEYTPANTRLWKGRRLCRECSRLTTQRIVERRKSA